MAPQEEPTEGHTAQNVVQVAVGEEGDEQERRQEPRFGQVTGEEPPEAESDPGQGKGEGEGSEGLAEPHLLHVHRQQCQDRVGREQERMYWQVHKGRGRTGRMRRPGLARVLGVWERSGLYAHSASRDEDECEEPLPQGSGSSALGVI